ncbi:hypothetical protein BDZ89DRAFT_1238472 [Hymenopellis radicata]|nr:hypothetical protein BDZ89DRAFT_1238472 [Hymenopellis radicata]
MSSMVPLDGVLADILDRVLDSGLEGSRGVGMLVVIVVAVDVDSSNKKEVVDTTELHVEVLKVVDVYHHPYSRRMRKVKRRNCLTTHQRVGQRAGRADVRKTAPVSDVHKAAPTTQQLCAEQQRRRGSPRMSWYENKLQTDTDRNLNQPTREADVASSAGGKWTCHFLGGDARAERMEKGL